MTSETVGNSEERTTDDKMVVIDICKKLEKLPTNEPNCDRVCICHVPKSVSSMKPEAFIPQFVGLGPYHHFRPDLVMTDELKLGLVKRVLKFNDNNEVFRQHLQDTHFAIQPFYHLHVDVHFTWDHKILLNVIIVDALFLFALLHSKVNTIRQVRDRVDPPTDQLPALSPREVEDSLTYILTGKPGMPLVNAAGVELTVDGILREVFMIENQIPTHVLEHINKVNNNEIHDLGSAMLKFCEALCPLVNFNKLPEIWEDHDHLLDLMYHLVGPPDPEPMSESGPEAEAEPEPEPEPKAEPWLMDKVQSIISKAHAHIYTLIWVTSCFCLSLYIFIVRLVLWLVPFLLSRLVPFLPRSQSTVSQSFTNILNSAKLLFYVLATFYFDDIVSPSYTYLPFNRKINRQAREITRGYFQNWDPRNYSESPETIPSTATELHNASIKLKPDEGGISCLKFYERSRLLYLPCIRLDPTSEVIIINLLAYESLTKSNNLFFTQFVKLLTTLIHTAEDVKLLVDNKIIQTRMTNEVVAQIFTEIRKSINNEPAEVQQMEQQIKEGIRTSIRNRQLITSLVTDFAIPFYISILVFFIYLWLLSVVASVYCIFNPSTRFCPVPDDHGSGNYFISSM